MRCCRILWEFQTVRYESINKNAKSEELKKPFGRHYVATQRVLIWRRLQVLFSQWCRHVIFFFNLFTQFTEH